MSDDYRCAEGCAAAARSDIRRTLVRYFQLVGDAERAGERASGLLDFYDQATATRIRAAATADDGPGTGWNWWDAAAIPDSIADLIAPRLAAGGVVTGSFEAVGEGGTTCYFPPRDPARPPLGFTLEFDSSPGTIARIRDALRRPGRSPEEPDR